MKKTRPEKNLNNTNLLFRQALLDASGCNWCKNHQHTYWLRKVQTSQVSYPCWCHEYLTSKNCASVLSIDLWCQCFFSSFCWSEPTIHLPACSAAEDSVDWMVFITGTSSNLPSYIFSLITAYLKAICASSLFSSNIAPVKCKTILHTFRSTALRHHGKYYAIELHPNDFCAQSYQLKFLFWPHSMQ